MTPSPSDADIINGGSQISIAKVCVEKPNASRRCAEFETNIRTLYPGIPSRPGRVCCGGLEVRWSFTQCRRRRSRSRAGLCSAHCNGAPAGWMMARDRVKISCKMLAYFEFQKDINLSGNNALYFRQGNVPSSSIFYSWLPTNTTYQS